MIDENQNIATPTNVDVAEQENTGTEVPTVGEGTTNVEKQIATEEVAKTFTQEQVNEMMRSRLDRDRHSFYNRYGVKNRNELDALIGKSQSYDVMKERLARVREENNSLKERIAFRTNNINPAREDDIRAYFKGKGIGFNEEALVQELASHPEWLNIVVQDTTPKTTIKTLGVEHGNGNKPETDDEKRKRIFGY